MARHSRRVLLTLVVAIAAVLTVEARGFQTQPTQPRQQSEGRDGRREQTHECRPWWKEAKCVAQIGISPEQSATIDAIFKSEIEKMKPLRDSINRMERELNDTVRANTTEVAAFTRQVQKIEKMRAELNTTD